MNRRQRVTVWIGSGAAMLLVMLGSNWATEAAFVDGKLEVHRNYLMFLPAVAAYVLMWVLLRLLRDAPDSDEGTS